MGVGIDGRGYLGQMRVHGLAIAVGHDQARRFAFGRADGAEDIDPFGALVVRRPGPGAPARPTPCDLVFLTDARFVLPPKLYLDTIRETLAELRQLGREVFLKSSNANSFWAWWRGRAVILVNPIAFNSPAHGGFSQRDAEFVPNPLRQILEPPAHHAMDRRDRPLLNDLHQRPALAVVELGGFTRRLAVDQAARPFRIEAQDPIADDLKPDAADPRRIRAPAAVIDLCQGNKPTALPRILRSLGQAPQIRSLKIFPPIAAPMAINRFTMIDSASK